MLSERRRFLASRSGSSFLHRRVTAVTFWLGLAPVVLAPGSNWFVFDEDDVLCDFQQRNLGGPMLTRLNSSVGRAVAASGMAVAVAVRMFAAGTLAASSEQGDVVDLARFNPPGLVVNAQRADRWNVGLALDMSPIEIPSLRQGVVWNGTRFLLEIANLATPLEAERALNRRVAQNSGAVNPGPIPGYSCPGEDCWHSAAFDDACSIWIRRGTVVYWIQNLERESNPPPFDSTLDLAREIADRIDASPGLSVETTVEPAFFSDPSTITRNRFTDVSLSDEDLPGWTIVNSGSVAWLPAPNGEAPATVAPAVAQRFVRRNPTLEETTLVYRLFTTHRAASEAFAELGTKHGYVDLQTMRSPLINEWLGGCPGDECLVYLHSEFRLVVRTGDLVYLVRRTYVPATSQGGPQGLVSESGQIARMIAMRYQNQYAQDNGIRSGGVTE
jgi:hypothetical protein